MLRRYEFCSKPRFGRVSTGWLRRSSTSDCLQTACGVSNRFHYTWMSSSSSRSTIWGKGYPRRRRVITLTRVSTCKRGMVFLNVEHCLVSCCTREQGPTLRAWPYSDLAREALRAWCRLEPRSRGTARVVLEPHSRGTASVVLEARISSVTLNLWTLEHSTSNL